jgi:hypothetical protein
MYAKKDLFVTALRVVVDKLVRQSNVLRNIFAIMELLQLM